MPPRLLAPLASALCAAVLLAAPVAAHESEGAGWAPWKSGPRLGLGATDVLRQLPIAATDALDVDPARLWMAGPAQLRALDDARTGGAAVAHYAGGRPAPAQRHVAVARRASTETGAAEPTLGVGADGTLYFVGIAGAGSAVLRSRDEGASWERLDVLVPGQSAEETTFDPFLWVDDVTGRLWNADLTTPNCGGISWSDDGGETFGSSLNCLHTDHQNLFAGPPPPGGAAPSGHPHVVYYCSNDGGATLESLGTGCSKSLDGGSVWTRTGALAFHNDPTRTGGSFGIPGFCSGATGHGVVDSAGTVFLPRGWCDQPYLAISTDEGATWERIQVSDLGVVVGIEDEVIGTAAGFAVEDHEASVAVDPAGNVFYMWIAADHLPYVAISRDNGRTFGKPLMVAAPGVNEAWGPSIDAGDTGRIAFTYVGTTNSPGGPYCVRTTSTTTCETADGRPATAAAAYEGTTWSGYMGISVDALSAEPVFQTGAVNEPSDPLVRGGGCGPVRCLAQLDFLDVVVARDGTPWASFVDACDGETCSSSGLGIVGRLVSGPPLVGTLDDQRPVVAAPPSTPPRAPRCTPPRKVTLRIARPRRGRLRSVRVTANGRRLKVRRARGGRRTAVIDLRRSAGRTVRVVIVTRTSTGRQFRAVRRYRVCG